MEDLFKKFLYTSVGLVALTAEKMQEAMDDLVKDGKISTEEGKKIVNEFMESTEAKREEFESKIRTATESVVNNLNVPSQEEFKSMQDRIQELEAKLAELTKEKK